MLEYSMEEWSSAINLLTSNSGQTKTGANTYLVLILRTANIDMQGGGY